MFLHIVRDADSSARDWETKSVVNFDDAVRIIKQRYPEATFGPWRPDPGSGSSPTAEIMQVYQDHAAMKRGCPIVARIRRAC